MTGAKLRPPSSIGGYFPDAFPMQQPSDVAVVTPTVLRPALVEAIESVYRQTYPGRIQLLVGIDKTLDDLGLLNAVLAERPPNISAIVLALPFSTSIRHGGVHAATDGGALRSILSFMANTRHLAYLDDDNSWEPDHLALLMRAVEGKAWAYALRQLVDEATGRTICVDRWDSVGVARGRFAEQGGLVDPNCLLVDKVAVSRAFALWSEGPGATSDRNFFAAIKDAPHGRVERATVRYKVRPTNIMLQFLREGREF